MADLKMTQLCDSESCKDPVVWLVLNDLDIPKARFCEQHAMDWSATNKSKTRYLMGVEEYERQADADMASQAPVAGRQPGGNSASRDQKDPEPVQGQLPTRPDRRGSDSASTSGAPLATFPSSERGVRQGATGSGQPDAASSSPGFQGASELELTDEQCRALMAPLDPDTVDIKPDGNLYWPQAQYRRRLCLVFRPAGWALEPVTNPQKADNMVYREFYLYIRGHFVATGLGQQQYFPNNPRMSLPDAVEACKSDALVRACKDLGIATELWDWRYCQEWKKKYAVLVNVSTGRGDKWQWRRKDKDPFPREKKPGRGSESEYHKPQTLDQEAWEHVSNIE